MSNLNFLQTNCLCGKPIDLQTAGKDAYGWHRCDDCLKQKEFTKICVDDLNELRKSERNLALLERICRDLLENGCSMVNAPKSTLATESNAFANGVAYCVEHFSAILARYEAEKEK